MWLIALLILILVCLLVPAAFKKRIPTVQNVNQGLVVFDDFIEPSARQAPLSYQGTSFTGAVLAGAASVDQTVAYGDRNYPGAVAIAVNTSNDQVSFASPVVLTLDHSTFLDTQTRFFLSGLINNVTHTFGFSDALGDRGSEGDAAVIYFNKNTSNNYVCYAKSSDTGTSTQVITTVPGSISTDTYFRILVTPNFIYYYINSVLVATINLSLNPAVHLGCGWGVEVGGAITPVTMVVDAISITQQFDTPRTFVNPASQ